jgi:hypothetical protein
MLKTLSALIILAATALPGATSAQVAAGRGPVLLTLPASTRALGMGNAFAIGSTDSDALFYNTAFADRLRGAGAAVQWYGSTASSYTMSAAMEWWRGALAVGVRALDHGVPEREEDRFRPGEGTLQEGGVRMAERAVSLAYARSIRGVRVGAAGHMFEQRQDADRSVAAAADVSVGMLLGAAAAGLSVRSLGPSYEHAGADVDLPLAVTLAAAAVSAAPIGPLDVLPAAYVSYEDGDVVPGAGVELSYWPLPGRTFSLRLGARRVPDGVQPFTAGAGFTGDRIILDYAVVPYDGARWSHRIGLRWR